MVKSILSLVLATTHLISWSAAPVYLCISDDGSMCLESAPETCDCCHDLNADVANASTCVDEHCAAHDHAAAACDQGHDVTGGDLPALVAAAPCDCVHVELPASRGPAIVRTSSSVDPGEPLAVPAPIVGVPAPAEAVMDAHRADVCQRPGSTHFLSTALRSVVLRC